MSETTFWMKCGKLLTNGSSLIKCRTCPCGYYGLFVFVARSIDSPSGTPNYCYQPSIEVAPYEVIDGKIEFSGYMGVMWSGCIQINLQQDSKGRVGYAKGCGSSWEECVQWDESWEHCIRTETVYMDCYEIDVYRLGPCFEDLNEFKAFVYSKCPELTPPYPDLWQTYYGRKYISSAAANCIYKNWDVNNDDSWYVEAYFKYVPKAKFEWTRYDNNICIQLNNIIGHSQPGQTYYYCDGNCREYGDNGCVDCDGTMQSWTDEYWVADCNGHQIFQPSWGGSEIYSYTWPLCERESWQPECKCIDAHNAAAVAGISDINDEIDDILGDTSQYWIGQQTNNISPCFNTSYSSRFQPNECWASWWIEQIHRKWCYYAKLKIQKWNDKVKYNGVHIRIYAVDNKGNAQGGGNHPLSVEHTQTVLYDQQMDVLWGQEFTFPLVNNMIGWSLANNPHCVNYGDYEYAKFYPYDSACENCQTVSISITVLYKI